MLVGLRSVRLDRASEQPVWLQVANDLRTEMDAGRLAVGVRLPAEHELAALYGVSRSAVRRAVKTLVDAGFAEVVRGQGTFVTSSRPIIGFPRYH